MDLINFDDIVKEQLGKSIEYKKNEWFLPKNPSHYIICGSTGCGKTSLLLNMLFRYMKFDKLVLCAKQNHEDKYEFLEKFFTELANEHNLKLDTLFETYNNLIDLPEVSTLEDDENTKVIIFDDMVNDKHQEKIKDYFIAGRKKGYSCFYLSQRFTDVPKMIRNNAQMYIFYAQRPKEIQIIHQDLVSGDMPVTQFRKLFNSATAKKFSFLCIDMTNPDFKYRRNFLDFWISKP